MEELDGENRTEGHVLGVEAKGVWLVVRGNNELDEPATDRVTVQVKSFWLRAIMSGQHVGVSGSPVPCGKSHWQIQNPPFLLRRSGCIFTLGTYDIISESSLISTSIIRLMFPPMLSS